MSDKHRDRVGRVGMTTMAKNETAPGQAVERVRAIEGRIAERFQALENRIEEMEDAETSYVAQISELAAKVHGLRGDVRDAVYMVRSLEDAQDDDTDPVDDPALPQAPETPAETATRLLADPAAFAEVLVMVAASRGGEDMRRLADELQRTVMGANARIGVRLLGATIAAGSFAS